MNPLEKPQPTIRIEALGPNGEVVKIARGPDGIQPGDQLFFDLSGGALSVNVVKCVDSEIVAIAQHHGCDIAIVSFNTHVVRQDGHTTLEGKNSLINSALLKSIGEYTTIFAREGTELAHEQIIGYRFTRVKEPEPKK
jgi:hypothetical protein